MNWEDLRFFLEAVKHSSLKIAATSLKLNESELRSGIARLEKFLGIDLFELDSEFLTLTAEGNDLFKSVIKIEDEIKTASIMLLGESKNIRQEITIVKPEGFFSDWFMKSFRSLKDTYPNIDFIVKNSHEKLDISKYQADVEILLTNDPERDIANNVSADKISDIFVAPYIAEDLVEDGGLFTALENISWIRGWQDRFFVDWLNESGHENMNHGWYIDGLKTQIDAVKFGLGVAFLPCKIADNVQGIQKFSDDAKFKAIEMWFIKRDGLDSDEKSQVIAQYIYSQIKSRYNG